MWPWYLHDFEEGLDGLRVLWELLHQVVLHVRLARQDRVLPLVVIQADVDGVKVLLQLLELQLTFSQLVESNPQQAVLMKLADVVKACRRDRACCQMVMVFLRKEKNHQSHNGATVTHSHTLNFYVKAYLACVQHCSNIPHFRSKIISFVSGEEIRT